MAVPPYQKSGEKSDFEWHLVAKKAIFGQKVPKKCHFAVRMAPFGKVLKIRLRILNFQIFLV